MKRKLVLLIAMSLLLALLATGSVLAQSPGGLSYTSGVQVVNLDSTTANIGLTYYDQAGNVAATASDTVPGSGSKTYFPIHAAAGFNGSLVISSDKPITAIANTVTTNFAYGAATTSFSAGSTSLNLPLIMCNNSGYNTWFNVQSAGTNSANITIHYIPGTNGVAQSEGDTIAPGAAHTFDQAIGSSTENCSTLADGTGKFIGSATITSDEPVVATVMQLNTTSIPTLLGYNGFANSGSTTVVAPLVMAQNSGFFSGIQIQNTGSGTTTIDVDYSPNQVANGFEPANQGCANVPVGGTCTLITNGGQWTQQYIGSATITSSPAENMVVIVNTVKTTGAKKGASYEAFNPANASADVSAPLVMANNSGFFTGIQTMNVGADCALVTIDYGPNTAGAFNPNDETFSLLAGESLSVIQNGNSLNNTWGTNKYIGSAEISAPGCSIVVTVNELGSGAGDNLFTYIGYNK